MAMAPGGRAFTRGDELVSVLADRGVNKENYVLVAHLAAATKAVADKYKFLLAEVKPRYFMSFYNTTIKYDTVVCMQLELEPDKWRVVQEIKLHFANDFDYASDDEYVPMSKGRSKPYFFKHGGKVVDLMEIYLKQIFNDSKSCCATTTWFASRCRRSRLESTTSPRKPSATAGWCMRERVMGR